MKQMSLSEAGFERKTNRIRMCDYLDKVNLVVDWGELVGLIAPSATRLVIKQVRRHFGAQTMQRTHCLLQWFNLLKPAMEEALHFRCALREFGELYMAKDELPEKSTILRFWRLLKTLKLNLQILAAVNAIPTTNGSLLKNCTVGDATLSGVACLIKNSTGTSDVEMQPNNRGNKRHHGMKALLALPTKLMAVAC